MEPFKGSVIRFAAIELIERSMINVNLRLSFIEQRQA